MSKKQSVFGDHNDWRVRITTGVAVAVCMAGTMTFAPMLGIKGLGYGILAVMVAIVVGIFLGRLVGGLLFRPSSG